MSEPNAFHETHPFFWAIRRELWEHRSVWIAPLLVSGLMLFTSCGILASRLVKGMHQAAASSPEIAHQVVAEPFSLAPAVIMFTTFVVGLFYAIDALYGERRDRSILFWKSLPVSDRTTVLSKAAIPLAVLPGIAFVLSLAVVIVLLMFGNLILMAHRVSPLRLWVSYQFVPEVLIMSYGLIVFALWTSPIYSGLLLISAWARRSPFLWALFPPLLIVMFERAIFHTTYFAGFLKYRWMGAMHLAFDVTSAKPVPIFRLSQLTPLRFLTSPGLWLGLLFAALFLAGAIRVRRRREPI